MSAEDSIHETENIIEEPLEDYKQNISDSSSAATKRIDLATAIVILIKKSTL